MTKPTTPDTAKPKMIICPKCTGTGEITRFYGGGIYDSTIVCNRCDGQGKTAHCTCCSDTGLTADGDNCQECNTRSSQSKNIPFGSSAE